MMPLPFLGCLMSSGGAPAWTPADLAPSFWLQAPAYGSSDRLTLNSGRVSAVADAAGGAVVLSQGTAGRQPLWNNADVVDGYTSFSWDATRDDELASATGGITGAAPHTLIALCKLTDTTPVNANMAIMQYGPGSGSTGANSLIGTSSQAGGWRYWGGGPGLVRPLMPDGYLRGSTFDSLDLGVNTFDTEWHLLVLRYDGATVRMYIDGVEALPIAGSDPAITFAVSSAAIVAGNWYTTSAGGTASRDAIAKIWVPSDVSDFTDLHAWALREFPSLFPRALLVPGDSKGWGYNQTTSSRCSGVLATSLGMHEINAAVSGYTAQQILDSIPTLEAKLGIWPNTACILDSGINEMISASADSAATIFGRTQDTITAIRAAAPGVKICQATLMPSTLVTGDQETKRLAINALILASSTADCVADLAATAGLSTVNGTNFQDHTHLNDAGAIVAAGVYQAALATVGVS